MRFTRNNILCIALALTGAVLGPYGIAQERPRLVVGITVDQMPWEYMVRFKHRWHANGGIRRMLDEGFALQHTSLNYLPSFTACGHASIYSGSVPAIHGITGNQWFDLVGQGYQYCTADTMAKTVGSQTDAGEMSPRNLLTTTIADELRLATAFRGKTVGIAIKDRGGILPVGHSANAAYWYDPDEGKWISSTYYMQQLPEWIGKFNTKAKVDSLYGLDWHLLYKEETYTAFPIQNKLAEQGIRQRQFPQGLKRFIGNKYDIIAATPQGNTLTTEFAKACIVNEQLGADTIPDMIAISYSSIDYLGHTFGPMSYEVEDAMLKLDIELGAFFRFLDKQVGAGAWLAFLTSDHGVAQVPALGKAMKLPSGIMEDKQLNAGINEVLKAQFGLEGLCKGVLNQQVILNIDLIKRVKKLSTSDVLDFLIPWLEQQPGILRVVRLDGGNATFLPEMVQKQIRNGYYPRRSGNLQILYKSGYVEGVESGGTSHGTGYTYDTRIPLLWYGWKVPKGQSFKKVNVTDIAPTLSALLYIQEPSGCIGDVITEIVEQTKH